MCLTENSISECAESISQMVAPACGSAVVVSRVPVIVMHLTVRSADGDCRYQSVRCVLGRPGGVAVDQQHRLVRAAHDLGAAASVLAGGRAASDSGVPSSGTRRRVYIDPSRWLCGRKIRVSSASEALEIRANSFSYVDQTCF